MSVAYFHRDKNYLFYGRKKIENSDPESFISLSSEYAKDKNQVYFFGYDELTILQEANSNTFQLIDEMQKAGNNCGQDGNYIFCNGQKTADYSGPLTNIKVSIQFCQIDVKIVATFKSCAPD